MIAECNVIAPGAEKVPTAAPPFSPFPPFGPHIGCHNAYIFESADGCYAYGAGCITSASVNDPSLAMVREKLKTIEETQSDDGTHGHHHTECSGCAAVANGERPCCMASDVPNGVPFDTMPGAPVERAPPVPDDDSERNSSNGKLTENSDGIEMLQFDKDRETPKKDIETEHNAKDVSEIL